MRKHIIIAGAPRSGKSTIASLIAKKYGYQHISMDSIIAGIEKTFPELGINSDSDIDVIENTKFISEKISKFIQSMIDSGEYDEQDYGMVIDVCELLPCDYVKNINPNYCEIYYFGTSSLTGFERFEELKKYDTDKDYTYYLDDTLNKKKCDDIVRLSKYNEEECKKYGFLYFETSGDRENLFNWFINNIENIYPIENIKTPLDILIYLNYNIVYGWLDINDKKHISSMKDFRRLYRTSTLDEILKYKMGVCAEQVLLIKMLLDKLNIESKMFCTRIYEDESFNDLDSNEHMHCFILYYMHDKVYQIEHPNFFEVGIKEFNSEDEAIEKINEYYVNMSGGYPRPVTQYLELPPHVSFKELNIYMNNLEEHKINNDLNN